MIALEQQSVDDHSSETTTLFKVSLTFGAPGQGFHNLLNHQPHLDAFRQGVLHLRPLESGI